MQQAPCANLRRGKGGIFSPGRRGRRDAKGKPAATARLRHRCSAGWLPGRGSGRDGRGGTGAGCGGAPGRRVSAAAAGSPAPADAAARCRRAEGARCPPPAPPLPAAFLLFFLGGGGRWGVLFYFLREVFLLCKEGCVKKKK